VTKNVLILCLIWLIHVHTKTAAVTRMVWMLSLRIMQKLRDAVLGFYLPSYYLPTLRGRRLTMMMTKAKYTMMKMNWSPRILLHLAPIEYCFMQRLLGNVPRKSLRNSVPSTETPTPTNLWNIIGSGRFLDVVIATLPKRYMSGCSNNNRSPCGARLSSRSGVCVPTIIFTCTSIAG
jgi:hypothetical protein